MTESNDKESNLSETSSEDSGFDRREIMTKLVAAAALAATGFVAGEAGAETKAVNKASGMTAVKLDKSDKWMESFKFYKDSALKFQKLKTGFRVEIHAPAELGSTLRSMGLVPEADGGVVKLTIEFSNS